MDAPLIVFHIFEVKFNFWEPHFPDTKFYPNIAVMMSMVDNNDVSITNGRVVHYYD